MSESTEVNSGTGEVAPAAPEVATQEKAEGLDPQAAYRTAYDQQALALAQEKAELHSKLAEAQSRAEKSEKTLASFQRNTTYKLQRLAELEREQEKTDELRAELAETRLMLQRLTENMLEPTDQQKLQLEKQQLALENQQKAMQRAQQRVQTTASESVDIDAYKAQLLREHAPGTSIQPEDPRIDWAGDAPNFDAWKARFLDSVRRAEISTGQNGSTSPAGVAQPQAQLTTSIQAETEAQLAAMRADFEKRLAEIQQGSEAQAAKAKEEARKATEARLREGGIDTIDPTARPQTDTSSGVQAIEDDLDINLLKTPAGKQEYARRERLHKARLFGFAQ